MISKKIFWYIALDNHSTTAQFNEKSFEIIQIQIAQATCSSEIQDNKWSGGGGDTSSLKLLFVSYVFRKMISRTFYLGGGGLKIKLVSKDLLFSQCGPL